MLVIFSDLARFFIRGYLSKYCHYSETTARSRICQQLNAHSQTHPSARAKQPNLTYVLLSKPSIALPDASTHPQRRSTLTTYFISPHPCFQCTPNTQTQPDVNPEDSPAEATLISFRQLKNDLHFTRHSSDAILMTTLSINCWRSAILSIVIGRTPDLDYCNHCTHQSGEGGTPSSFDRCNAKPFFDSVSECGYC